MIKEFMERRLEKLCIGLYKETIQLIKMHDEDHINTIFHFSTNTICFVILSGYSIVCSEELFTLSCWLKKFLYNLRGTIKAFSILFVIDLCIRSLSPRDWELLIGYIYNDFRLAHNDNDVILFVVFFPFSPSF
ncbi:chloroplast envelope membrane protein [Citrus sinensis]|nr:chloroplast envelope membrane protein [Citrus sinensis]